MTKQQTTTVMCARCGHPEDKHYANRCHHIETWLGLHRREFRACDCFMSGPEDRAAGALWNAFMGRDANGREPA